MTKYYVALDDGQRMLAYLRAELATHGRAPDACRLSARYGARVLGPGGRA